MRFSFEFKERWPLLEERSQKYGIFEAITILKRIVLSDLDRQTLAFMFLIS